MIYTLENRQKVFLPRDCQTHSLDIHTTNVLSLKCKTESKFLCLISRCAHFAYRKNEINVHFVELNINYLANRLWQNEINDCCYYSNEAKKKPIFIMIS